LAHPITEFSIIEQGWISQIVQEMGLTPLSRRFWPAGFQGFDDRFFSIR
jgi:hypothetical protein